MITAPVIGLIVLGVVSITISVVFILINLYERKELTKKQNAIDSLNKTIQGHIELNKEYRVALQQKNSENVHYVAIIPPKNETEVRQYLEQIGYLSKWPWYISFFENLKREGVEKFALGKENADFWRGWLAVICRIFDESRNTDAAIAQIEQRIAAEAEESENK